MEAETTSGGSAKAAPAPAEQWKKFEKTDWHQKKVIAGPAIVAAFKGDFAQLEEMAEEFRANNTRRPDGGFALQTFYSAFGDYSDWNQRNAEEYHPVLLAKIEKWRAAYPDSPTPHVALASYYVGHAWDARGGGWAKDVTEEGWRLFEERLQKAMQVLEEGGAVGTADPAFYGTALTLATGAGFEVETTLNIAGEGVQRHPSYWGNYYKACYFLLPRWHGSDHAQWHTFLVEILKVADLSQEEKDEIYAFVTVGIIDFAYIDSDDPNAFKVSNVDWERLETGAEMIMKKFPEGTSFPSEYLNAAVSANKVDVARNILQRMNFRFDGAEWRGKNDQEFFDLLKRLEASD